MDLYQSIKKLWDESGRSTICIEGIAASEYQGVMEALKSDFTGKNNYCFNFRNFFSMDVFNFLDKWGSNIRPHLALNLRKKMSPAEEYLTANKISAQFPFPPRYLCDSTTFNSVLVTDFNLFNIGKVSDNSCFAFMHPEYCYRADEDIQLQMLSMLISLKKANIENTDSKYLFIAEPGADLDYHKNLFIEIPEKDDEPAIRLKDYLGGWMEFYVVCNNRLMKKE